MRPGKRAMTAFAAGASDDVAEEEQPHVSRLRFDQFALGRDQRQADVMRLDGDVLHLLAANAMPARRGFSARLRSAIALS